MIIERLDLRAFGKFTDVSIDLSAGPNRFHLIYGPNESGKSTSLRAITALLFGFPHLAEDSYVHASAQMRVAGRFSDDSGRVLECVRRRGRKGTLRDADDNEPIDETLLNRMLGGIDQETFRTRFGLSHIDLVRGGSEIVSGEGDLGQILFSAGAGVSQLREIQEQLDEAAKCLFTARGSKPAINAAVSALEDQRRDLRAAQLSPGEFNGLRSRLDAKRAESEQLNKQLQQCVTELAQMRSLEQAIPLAPQWRSTISQMSKLANVPPLDESFSDRRRQAMADREVAISARNELEHRLRELTTRLEGLPRDTVVMNHEAEIQSLFQEISTHAKAELDKKNLIRLAANNDRKIIDVLRDLSIEVNVSDENSKAESIQKALESVRLSDSLRNQVRELASQHSRLLAQRNDASDAVETTKRRLADTIQEIESLGTPPDPTVLTTAIEAVGDPQTLIEDVAQRQANCDALRGRCENLLSRLEGFSGDIPAATTLQPPTESNLLRLSRQLQSVEARRLAVDQRYDQLRQERDQIDEELRDAIAGKTLPTLDDLEAARMQRDCAADDLASQLEAGKDAWNALGKLRDQIANADQLVDTIRAHHEQVHRRESLMARRATFEARLERAAAESRDLAHESDQVQAQWQSIWDHCGVKAGTPERMQRWLADHEQLCEFEARLSEEQKQLSQAQQRVARAVARLQSAVAAPRSKRTVAVGPPTQGGLFDQSIDEDLVSLYDDALSRRTESVRANRHLDATCSRRDELTEQLPKAETHFESCQANLQQWRDEWRRCTASFLKSEQATTREALQMLDQTLELQQMKKDRDVFLRRIESIDRDRSLFTQRVQRLAANTDEPIDEKSSADAIAQSIYQRLQVERTAARSRDTLRDQIDTTRQRLADSKAKESACTVVLQQLCREAGCEAENELPDLEATARQRFTLQQTLRDLENQLGLLAADEPLDQFIERASSMQPALLHIEIEQKQTQLDQLRSQIATVEQEYGVLRHELEQMDGGARASDLVQSIQLVAGQVSRDAQQYARYRVASLILRRAIDHYRDQNQSPVLARAEHFFTELTCGEYRQLKVDYNSRGKSTLVGVRTDDGPDVPADAMSTGTADVLYLALRLASLQHQISNGTSIPLIIDDCLVQLDDRRAAAALRALSELSKTTQVILFTHHRHVVQLAEQNLRDDDFHVHALENTD